MCCVLYYCHWVATHLHLNISYINVIISAFILNCVEIRVPIVYSVHVYVHLLLEWWWWWWWLWC